MSVLEAFGASELSAVPLAGGQGTSWRADGAVLKPADHRVPELEWLAAVYSHIRPDGFRIARQLRAADGAVCVEGWSATEYVTGVHAARRWADVIAAGERFHAALAGLDRPAFLDTRHNAWSTGDRVAWGEIPAARFAQVRHLGRLVAALRPVEARSQLIHGDLGGNVLFADTLPPAIIDFAPYWRPAAFATAIVIADALVWEGADASAVAAVGHLDEFPQYLLRALIYRAVTESILSGANGAPVGTGTNRCQNDPYAPAVDLACQLAVDGHRR